TENPEQFISPYSTILPGERLPNEFLTQITDLSQELEQLIMQSANTEVVRINRSAVSDGLRLLHKTASDPYQQEYIAETIRALETGACRAAIVMGWNIAFDHLRQWIFASPRKRLKAFNAVTTTRNRKPLQVAKYDDFFDHRERDVIEDAYEGKLF